MGHYPHLRVQRSPDTGIREQETSILADPLSLDVDTRTCSDGHSRISSEGHIVKVPYFDENCVDSNACPRILTSNFSESYSYHCWEEIEKQSNGTSEDLCKEVRCIETEELSNKVATESNSLCSEENTGFPEIKVYVNGDAQTMESPSTPFENDGVFKSSPLKTDIEMKEDIRSRIVPSKEDQGQFPASLKEDKESLPPLCKKEREFSSIQSLDIQSLNISLTHELDKDSSVTRSSKLTKSRSCKASIAVPASPWFKMMDYSENTSSFGSERGSVGCGKKGSPLSFSPNMQSLSRKDSQSSPGNAFDIEIDTPNEKFPTAESSTTEMKEKTELPTQHIHIKNQVSYVFFLLDLLSCQGFFSSINGHSLLGTIFMGYLLIT